MNGLDPRDPRNAPPDPRTAPLDLPPAEPLVAGRHDEELTEQYGPVVPEPKWEKPMKPFSRERFLLYCFALALVAQYAVLTIGVFLCYSTSSRRLLAGLPPLPVEVNRNCVEISQRLENVFQVSLSTILALLGGGAIAVGEYQRRHPPDQR